MGRGRQALDRRPADPEGLLEALDVPLERDLLVRALTHRSFAYENGGLPTNERLEFLGDSVLGLVVTDSAGTPLYMEYKGRKVKDL